MAHLVAKGSPAAMGGLKFGDQILQINNETVAGYTADKVNSCFERKRRTHEQIEEGDRQAELNI